MWDRRGWLKCSASLALGVGLSSALAQTAAPVPPSRPGASRLLLVVDNRAAFCYLPLTIAERLGYFASEGLELEVREVASTEKCLQALLSGQAQVYSGSYSSTLGLQSREQVLQSFVLQGRAPQIVMGVSRKTMAHFQQLRDLRGKRIGIKGVGTGSHRVAGLLLAKAGIGAQEVQFVSLPEPAKALEAFRRAQLDAICYTDPTITSLELDAELRIVADTRTVRGTSDVFGGPMPAGCLMATEAFVTTQSRQCQALADAMVHALKWLQTAGPSDLIKTVPEVFFQGDRALYLAAFSRAREAWATDGMMPATGPATAARTQARLYPGAEILPVDLARTFTNDFSRKAKIKFRA
jgi:NitT/TauT family transport system substrate-binding protein